MTACPVSGLHKDIDYLSVQSEPFVTDINFFRCIVLYEKSVFLHFLQFRTQVAKKKNNPIINTCFSLLLSRGIQEKLSKMEYCRTIKLHLYCGFSTISLAVRINDPASSITAFPKSG